MAQVRREAARTSPREPPEAEFNDLTVDDVSRHFGRRRAVSRIILPRDRGAILGLLGPNGAGKSTLLALLGTLLRPSAGSIRYGAHERGRPRRRACVRRSACSATICSSIRSSPRARIWSSLPGSTASPIAAERRSGARAGRPRRPRRRSGVELLTRDAAARRPRARADSSSAPAAARRAVHRAGRRLGGGACRAPRHAARPGRHRHPGDTRSRSGGETCSTARCSCATAAWSTPSTVRTRCGRPTATS